MLAKNRRIGRKLFPNILTKGKRYNSPILLLYVSTPSVEKNFLSRFAFSISKKTAKLAVDRNKHRRRGYSIITKYLKNIKPGYFCFFSFKKNSSSIKFEQIEREIINLLKTSGVIS